MASLETADDIAWDTLELLRGEPDASVFFVEVLLELDADLREALLDLLEAVPLGPGWDTETIGDVGLALLLQQALALRVQGRILLEGRVDQLEDVLTHRRLDCELVHYLLGLGRGRTQVGVPRHGLVEADDAVLQAGLVLVLGNGQDDILKGRRLGRDLSRDLVEEGACRAAEGAGVLEERGRGCGEARRRLGRLAVLLGRHGARGDALEWRR